MDIKPAIWAIPLILLIAGVGAVRYWQNNQFEEAVDLLLRVEAIDVTTLCIVENYKCTRRLTSDDEIQGFLSAISDIEEFTTPKASNGESVTVLLLEPQSISIQARIRSEDDFAFGRIGLVDGAFSTTYVGSFRSEGLREWVESILGSSQSQE